MSEDNDNLIKSEVFDGDVKACYSAFKGSEQIAASLKRLSDGLRSIPEAAEMLVLANSVKFDYGRMLSRTFQMLKAQGKNSALAILKNHWKLHEKNPSNELLFMLNKHMGISQVDLAVLTGVSQVAIMNRVERYRDSLMPSDLDPDSVGGDDEKAEVVMRKLYRVASSHKIDRESINAAKVFLELYNKKVERSAIEKWKQVEILAEFFFSRLIPAIHQSLIKAGIKIDIRSICLPLFEDVSQEVREVLTKARLPESTPKKRGRKKNESK